jgi:hypothetical protein
MSSTRDGIEDCINYGVHWLTAMYQKRRYNDTEMSVVVIDFYQW